MTAPTPISSPRIIVALDTPTRQAALAMVALLNPSRCRLKVGHELFTAAGPAVVETLIGKGFDVFLDLKYHDIPNTVASACTAAANLGVWMLNVHTLGGVRMMQAAREAIDKAVHRPRLVGVTVLTSHSEEDLAELGLVTKPGEQVMSLARLAQRCGIDGVVCSAHEAASLRTVFGSGFCLVTPGIRATGSTHHDQQRVVTPGEAIQSGSHFLVIGRPVTAASDPAAALAAIQAEIDTVARTQQYAGNPS